MDFKPSQNQEWYQHWFNHVYASLYSHRNKEQAEKQVEALLSMVDDRACIQRVLDIACGGGRHVSALHKQLNSLENKQGIQIVGMDLSWDLLQTIDSDLRTQSVFLQGDMKHLPFPHPCFDLVTSFFSSYGYFKNPEEDRQALKGMLAPLKKGGFFFLDLVNKEVVLQNLISHDSKEMGNWCVEQKRSLEGNVIVKDIYLHSLSKQETQEVHTIHKSSKGLGTKEKPQHYQERLRVYSQEEMARLFANWGLKICHVFGSEEGEEYCKKSSPRMSFLIQKK